MEYKALHKSGAQFIVRASCVNRRECGNIVGHFAGRDDEVSIPFNELEEVDDETYLNMAAIICQNCQPLCSHSSYCDAFNECKFAEDMAKCDCATKGILVGTCTCEAEHVTIFLAKDGEDFKKDKKGNYIRMCQGCNKNIAPCEEGALEKLKRRNGNTEKIQVA